MTGKLNKKVLLFVDEYGTAGKDDLYFGAVIILAKDCGRIDKCFVDQLDVLANEIHAVRLDNQYLKDLMMRFYKSAPQECFALVNRKVCLQNESAPRLYAKGLIETVKVSVKIFREQVLKVQKINNVEIIIDYNQHNSHSDFALEISKAKSDDHEFRAVKHVASIDSAASRMLQLADIAAYSRKFILKKELNAKQLYEYYGIYTR
jgi:Protein of unknown function (DUF3800)